VGPTTGLDDMEKVKKRPYQDSNSDPSALQPVVSHYTNCTILAPNSDAVSYRNVLITISFQDFTDYYKLGDDCSILVYFCM
jgi:hypothetical protein